MRDLNLVQLFPEHGGLKRLPCSSILTVDDTRKMFMPCGCQPAGEFATSEGIKEFNQLTQIG